MLIDPVVKEAIIKIIDKDNKKYKDLLTFEAVHTIVDYQFKYVRNCIRGGTEVTLDQFGTFRSLTRTPSSKIAKYVKANGGLSNVLKKFVPTFKKDWEHLEDEVIFNTEFLKDHADKFTDRSTPVIKKELKRLPMFTSNRKSKL